MSCCLQFNVSAEGSMMFTGQNEGGDETGGEQTWLARENLPPLVETKTGEEEDEVSVCCQHACAGDSNVNVFPLGFLFVHSSESVRQCRGCIFSFNLFFVSKSYTFACNKVAMYDLKVFSGRRF